MADAFKAKPPKLWSDMTEGERALARRDMARTWSKFHPGEDPARLYSMLNSLDYDKSFSPSARMTHMLGETLLGLPGAVYDAGKTTLGGAAEVAQVVFSKDFARQYINDVTSGDQLERLVSPFTTAGSFYAHASFKEVGSAYADFAGAASKGGGKLTEAGLKIFVKTIDDLHDASVRGDNKVVANCVDRIAGDAIFQYLLGLGMTKAGTLIKGGMKIGGGAVAEEEIAAAAAKAESAVADHSKDLLHAPNGTAVDTPEKLAQFGHSAEEAKAIQTVSEKHNVLLDVRDAGADRLGALQDAAGLKSEWMKSKSITKLDAQLGWRQEDVGKIGYGKPKLPPGIESVDDLQGPLKERYLQRMKEFENEAPTIAKLEKGVPLRTSDPITGERTTTTLKAYVDENGVLRSADNGGHYAGDLDLHDIRRGSDGHRFFTDETGRAITREMLELGKPLADRSERARELWQMYSQDRKNMVAFQKDWRAIGGQHSGGYWRPKMKIRKNKNGIPVVNCKDHDIKRKVYMQGTKEANVRYAPGKGPSTQFGPPPGAHESYAPWNAVKAK